MSVGFSGISGLLKSLFVLRLGADPQYIGTFSATGAMAYAAMSLPAGMLGARFGVRQILRLGGVVSTVGMALTPLAAMAPESLCLTIPLVCEAITASGWSLVLVSLTPALVAYATPETRNRAFSVYAALMGVGGLVGMLVGGVLPGVFCSAGGYSLDDAAPYAWALSLAAVAMALGIVPMMFAGPTPTGEPRDHADDPRPSAGRGPFPWGVVVVVALYVVGSQGGWAMGTCFYNPYADTELAISPSRLGMISAIGQAFAIGAALCNPRLAKRWGNGGILLFSTLGVGLSNVLLAACPLWTISAVGRWGLLAFTSMRVAALQVTEMELVPPAWRSVAFGALSTISAGCVSLACLTGGWLSATRGSYRPGFWLGAALCAAGSAVALLLARTERDH